MRADRIALILAAAALLPLAAGAAEPPRYPAPERVWSTRDYIDFYFAHFNGNAALPHLRSEATKVLFERIVDEQNLARIQAGGEPMEEKRREIALVLTTMGEIRAAYNYAVFVGEPLSEELTQIQIFTLDVLEAAVKLSDGAIEPSRREAWKTTLLGVAASLAERDRYSERQIARLCDAISAHYRSLDVVLPEADRLELRRRLAGLAFGEGDPALGAAYARLRAAMEQ